MRDFAPAIDEGLTLMIVTQLLRAFKGERRLGPTSDDQQVTHDELARFVDAHRIGPFVVVFDEAGIPTVCRPPARVGFTFCKVEA